MIKINIHILLLIIKYKCRLMILIHSCATIELYLAFLSLELLTTQSQYDFLKDRFSSTLVHVR